jgi:hypothetical protein
MGQYRSKVTHILSIIDPDDAAYLPDLGIPPERRLMLKCDDVDSRGGSSGSGKSNAQLEMRRANAGHGQEGAGLYPWAFRNRQTFGPLRARGVEITSGGSRDLRPRRTHGF